MYFKVADNSTLSPKYSAISTRVQYLSIIFSFELNFTYNEILSVLFHNPIKKSIHLSNPKSSHHAEHHFNSRKFIHICSQYYFHFQPSEPTLASGLFPSWISFAFTMTSNQWIDAVCTFLCKASFTQHAVSMTHPSIFCYVLHAFLLLRSISLYERTTICLSIIQLRDI